MKEYVSICDGNEYKIYLSDLEEYWTENYGRDSWDEAEFSDIDSEIQQNNPELFFCDRGCDDRGKYLLYTTDENNAQ